MRHELRSEVHLPRVDGLDAVCVEHPRREHGPRHLNRGHPLHVPAQVAVDVARARSHVAARQRIEVGLALRQDPSELLMAPLRAPLLLALHRVAEVEAQALDAVLAVLDPLDVAEFGPAVSYDEAEHLREPGPAHRQERVYGLDGAASRLAREQDAELESNPPEEEREDALLALAGPADDGVHLHRVVANGPPRLPPWALLSSGFGLMGTGKQTGGPVGRDSAPSIVYARLEVMKLPTGIHLSRVYFSGDKSCVKLYGILDS